MIGEGLTKGDSSNFKKASFEKARHKVMIGTLQPNLEKAYTLSFSSIDRYYVVKSQIDPLVITALASSFKTQRMLVNTGSSMDVLFWNAF